MITNWRSTFSPRNFDSLEGFFTKFKSLVLMLKQCGIEKSDDQLILSILSKLGSDYSVFVSTFHATRLVVPKWKMPSLNYFLDSLTKYKSKCFYCRKGFHSYTNHFNNKMDIMSQLLEKHNIEVLDELEKLADSLEQCHSV